MAERERGRELIATRREPAQQSGRCQPPRRSSALLTAAKLWHCTWPPSSFWSCSWFNGLVLPVITGNSTLHLANAQLQNVLLTLWFHGSINQWIKDAWACAGPLITWLLAVMNIFQLVQVADSALFWRRERCCVCFRSTSWYIDGTPHNSWFVKSLHLIRSGIALQLTCLKVHQFRAEKRLWRWWKWW